MPRALRLVCFAVVLAALVSACRYEPDKKSEISKGAATATPPPGKKVDASTAGSIAGTIKFDGAVPPARVIPMDADPKCVAGAGPNPVSDALLVDAGKGVANTFIYVKAGLDPEYTFDTPTKPAILDQKGCLYSPRVLGVRVGQAIEIVNSDPTLHNVHSLPMTNREFNHGQPRQFQRTSEVFTAAEVMVRFKCDVHAWMAAWVGVVAHPYFAVSDATGTFKIDGLPPGKYTLEAWHEKLGTKTMEVTVAPSQAQSTNFTFTTLAK